MLSRLGIAVVGWALEQMANMEIGVLLLCISNVILIPFPFSSSFGERTSVGNAINPEMVFHAGLSALLTDRFNKREEAQEAVSALNNVIPQGGSQPLTVRVADDQNKAKTSMGYVPTYNSSMHRGMYEFLDRGVAK